MSPSVRAGVSAALLGAACALAPAAPARAAAPSPVPSASPTPPPSIGAVVTSDRRPESLATTTRPTFVVDRATIDAFGDRTVGDALGNVPGVDLFSYGPFGAQVNYGIRGTTSEQTLILQDGIPIIAGTSGSVDVGSLSTIGISRIEVVESGASTLYGTSATGGVVNVISDAQPQSYFRLADGSLGDRDLAAAFGTGGLLVSFERHVADNVYDYPAFAYAGGNATPAGTRTNADAQQSAVRLSYLAQLGAGWTARLTADDTATNIGVPGSLSFLSPDARQGLQREDGQLDIAHTAGPSTLSLSLSGSTQLLDYDYGLGQGAQDTDDARTQASLRYTTSGARTDLVAGLDVARESAVLTFPGEPIEAPEPAVGASAAQAAAYAQVGYDATGALRLVAGLRAEHDAPNGSVAAPSFGAKLALGAARLSANVGEAYRVPTLDELYYPGYANPSLLPEKLTDYDATLAFPALANLSLGYFGRDGSNLIVDNPTTFVPFNASRASVNGLQLNAATPAFGHLRLTAGVTDVYRALDTSTGLRLPNTPPIIATVGLERPFDGGALAYGARVRVVGQTADVPNYNATNAAPYADPFDAYTSADAYVRYRLARTAVLTARVRDLANARYAPIFGYPAPGRTFELELATR
ncbi:MAG TPA: TonB-dependent receptor [Candidatus Sulfotelmatobacter sp.]|nr:TonB-dependent receptor [Candidatus Sulfotelmatobacter sp.]